MIFFISINGVRAISSKYVTTWYPSFVLSICSQLYIFSVSSWYAHDSHYAVFDCGLGCDRIIHIFGPWEMWLYFLINNCETDIKEWYPDAFSMKLLRWVPKDLTVD